MPEGGSRSSKLSGAGGGRLFRDLDLLAEYMFSSSAYTADRLVRLLGVSGSEVPSPDCLSPGANLIPVSSTGSARTPMPKCVPMTRSSELRPLTLLLYVVPVTLMELLRRWGSGTTSGSGGGGGGGGGGGTGALYPRKREILLWQCSCSSYVSSW